MHSKRKRIKKNCVPCLRVPTGKKQEDKESQTNVMSVDISTQSDSTTCSFLIKTETIKIEPLDNIIQSTASLSADTPRKRKLESDFTNLKKQSQLEIRQMSEESQRSMFYELCERFLPKSCADVVKAQAELHTSAPRRRHSSS